MGLFVLKSTARPPYTIEVSSIGYASQKIAVSA
jgi:hypothetical protein